MKFAHDFLFGAATASYQIEGATDVDGKGPTNQGERMSVHFSTIVGMPAAKTFSKKLGFMRQRFCLATKLILVGSARTMFEAMCRRQAKFAAPLSL